MATNSKLKTQKNRQQDPIKGAPNKVVGTVQKGGKGYAKATAEYQGLQTGFERMKRDFEGQKKPTSKKVK